MDFREQALNVLKKTDTGKLGSSLFQKAGLLAWETGLGPVMNAFPQAFGQQAVLYFPGRSGKVSCPCCEQNGKVLLALTPSELEAIHSALLQSPGAEIWLKSGWYTGTARLLTPEEQDEVTASITDRTFFGNAAEMIGKRSLQDHSLLEVTCTAPCTGSSGPGSKSWVWPLALLLLLFSKKKK